MIYIFVIGCECFYVCLVYSQGHLKSGVEKLEFESGVEKIEFKSSCKFLAKMVYSSNIYLVIGIILLHEK